MPGKILSDSAHAAALILLSFFTGSMITPKATQKENFPTAGYEEILEASQTGTPLIIDARDPFLFSLGHIPNAINIPKDSEPKKIRKTAKENIPAIIYCSNRNCQDSEKLAGKLREAGHTNLKIYKGGWEEWEIINGQ